MYNDTITERDLLETVRATAEEILKYNPDAVDTDDDDLNDAITEAADGLVNVYTYACAQEWLAVGMPTPEDFGLENHPSGDIHKTISYVMFFWYNEKLTDEIARLIEKRDEDHDTEDTTQDENPLAVYHLAGVAWLCVDCTADEATTGAVPDEGDSAYRTFSKDPCDKCGSPYFGTRFRFTTWTEGN